METSNPEAVYCIMVGDHDTIQVSEVSVMLADDCMEEIPQGLIVDGPVVPKDPLQITADRVPEHPSGSGSKSTSKPNQVNYEFCNALVFVSHVCFRLTDMNLLYSH